MMKKMFLVLAIIVATGFVLSGITGCDLFTGPPGADGTNGVDGADGADGTDGADGEDAGNYLDVGAFDYEYTANQSRGFYFQAPVNFTIQDLQVYEDIGGGVQNIAVLRFVGAPPIYPSNTNNFEVLYYETDLPAEGRVDVNIEIFAGDHIGILGTRGTIEMHHAYGASGGYTSSIKGIPVVLNRLGMQYNMNSTAPQELWQEPTGQISIVHLRYLE